MIESPNKLSLQNMALEALNSTSYLTFMVLSNGSFAYINPIALTALGYTPEEAYSLRAPDILADFDSEERFGLRSRIERNNGGIVRAVLTRKDGTTFPVESSNHPIKVGDQIINCAICRNVSFDIQCQQANNLRKVLRATLTEQRKLQAIADELNIVGSSKQIQYLLDKARRYALNPKKPILITGESGSGKESIAKLVHALSDRKNYSLHSINCANLDNGQSVSKLFGHIKGAYTGSIRDRKGVFCTANGATLFLDEIGKLSLDIQQRLLRIIQEGTYYRLGDDKERTCDVRIIAATNHDLFRLVEEGKFLEDLYYRLEGLNLNVPPLRDRKSDIPELVKFYISKIRKETGFPLEVPNIDDMKRLIKYSYPGNIRQLFNILERAVYMGNGKELNIQPDLFPIVRSDKIKIYKAGKFPSLQEIQIKHVRTVLDYCNGRISGDKGAASLLGMDVSTLRGRMRKWGIDRFGN